MNHPPSNRLFWSAGIEFTALGGAERPAATVREHGGRGERLTLTSKPPLQSSSFGVPRPGRLLWPFLGPGLFGAALGWKLPFSSLTDGWVLMVALPGAAWLCFGPLCMAANRWTLSEAFDTCLGAMVPGSALLALAALGFACGGGWPWALGSVTASHFVMMAAFCRAGRKRGMGTARLTGLWLLGLDGGLLLLAGGALWV